MTIDANLGHDLADVVDFFVQVVEAAGAAIIFAGAVSAFARFVRVAFRREGMAPFAQVRLDLGRFLVLGLELMSLDRYTPGGASSGSAGPRCCRNLSRSPPRTGKRLPAEENAHDR